MFHCSHEDEQEIRAVETHEGNYHGAILMLDHVARKDEEWFAKLMWCLTQCGHADMVREILGQEAAEASM